MLKPGTVLSSYEIVSRVGAGGMGVVYRARHVRLGHDLALKVLLPHFTQSEKVRVRFQQEAYVQANLKHPSIVRALDVVEDGELLAVVMDWVEGPSLEEHLLEIGGRLSLPQLWVVMEPVLDAVEFAHECGVVHRDLKPANILLDRSRGIETPKVLDFGIAKILATEGARLTRTGAVMGTPSYMPPEQLKGRTDLDHRADIYALGVITYQLATGCLPFGEGSEYEITHRVLSGNRPQPATDLVPGLPPEFDAIIDRATSPDRDQRYSTISDLRADLKAVTKGGKPVAPVRAPRGKAVLPTVLERAPARPDAPAGGAAPPTVFEDPRPVNSRHTGARSEPPAIPGGQVKKVAVIVVLTVVAVAVAVAVVNTSDDIEEHGGAQSNTAISSQYPNCGTSSDCRANERCANSRCERRPYPYCTSNSDCRTGEECRSNQCQVRSVSSAEEAEQAYRGFVQAYNRADSYSYFRTYLDPIPCFYDYRNYSVSELREVRSWQFSAGGGGNRLEIRSMRTVSEGPTRIEFLIDETLYRTSGSESSYTKGVVMETTGGRWRITTEVSEGDDSCYRGLF